MILMKNQRIANKIALMTTKIKAKSWMKMMLMMVNRTGFR